MIVIEWITSHRYTGEVRAYEVRVCGIFRDRKAFEQTLSSDRLRGWNFVKETYSKSIEGSVKT